MQEADQNMSKADEAGTANPPSGGAVAAQPSATTAVANQPNTNIDEA